MVSKVDLSVFKIPIEVLPVNKDGVPFFMPVIINKLLENTKVVGIFRMCGSKRVIDQLGIEAIDVNFKIKENVGVHDLASFLKQWVRELPTPIITPSVINEYYKDDSVNSTKEVLRHLAPVNRKCIALIFSLLILISDQSDTNLMTLQNIYTCILPSILQYNQGIDVRFAFGTFFEQCIDLLNRDGNDFLLD